MGSLDLHMVSAVKGASAGHVEERAHEQQHKGISPLKVQPLARLSRHDPIWLVDDGDGVAVSRGGVGHIDAAVKGVVQVRGSHSHGLLARVLVVLAGHPAPDLPRGSHLQGHWAVDLELLVGVPA
jgi:hypothetical protein